MAQLSVTQPKNGCPIALRNMRHSGLVFFDTLHHKAAKTGPCSAGMCQGSLMSPAAIENSHTASIEYEVKCFFTEYFDYIPDKYTADEKEKRLTKILASFSQTGTYELTYDELDFGAKMAWRNSSRCIGRVQWSNLKLLDERHVTSAKEMFDSLCRHLQYGTNGGNIRSAITIFPPARDNLACRIWNGQFIQYAGYVQDDDSILGDPNNVELTKICLQLGWKPKKTRFDVLPLVLQYGDNNPELFPVPEHLVMEVPLKSEKHPKFNSLGLKWYAVPGVANMKLEIGGLNFTACAFNGWYMSTEVVRDLLDKHRYNLITEIAEAFDFDTSKPAVYWQDMTAAMLNAIILDSYKANRVAMTDHHSASESFMKHLENEQQLRGGCPSDWVWVTPPLGGTLTTVFHQEMLNYKLKPCYEYQSPAWINFVWRGELAYLNKRPMTFKACARGVVLCFQMMKHVLRCRKTCTILYASETGRSERFACVLEEIFSSAFNVQVECMNKYNTANLMNESLVLVVASTFGNGDAPDNGKKFEKHLQTEIANGKSISGKAMYAVFGLGSSAYPNFCAFARRVDEMLGLLKLKKLMELATGDEQKDQEVAFKRWSQQTFEKACKYFGASCEIGVPQPSEVPYMLTKSEEPVSVVKGLDMIHTKSTTTIKLLSVESLVAAGASTDTVLVKFTREGLRYEPGDHLALFPTNELPAVQKILERTTFPDYLSAESVIKLALPEGYKGSKRLLNRLPPCSLQLALTRFLDIDSPPSEGIVRLMATYASDEADQSLLLNLAENDPDFKRYISEQRPSLAEILDKFPSVMIPASFWLSQLPVLLPRYYSISSSELAVPDEIHLTLSVLKYAIGPENKRIIRRGLCTNWLKGLQPGTEVYAYTKRCPSFHLPPGAQGDIIMVGPGSGVAPFRGFWQEREYLIKKKGATNLGSLILYQGCRTQADVLLKDEVSEALAIGALTNNYVALSRQPGVPKTYVQHELGRNKKEVIDVLLKKKGYLYVCGDIAMAKDLKAALVKIVSEKLKSSLGIDDPEFLNSIVIKMADDFKKSGHYREDIYSVLQK